MKRVLGWTLAMILAAGAAAAGDGGQYLAVYGGYADNDGDSGAGASIPYGIRWGAETPVAGGQISLEQNRDGGVEMDTLLFSILFNFASKDSRTKQGRIIFNRASGFLTLGLGTMLYRPFADADRDWFFAYEAGVGTQVKFNRRVGLRIQANAIMTGSENLLNLEGTVGLGFYW
jgi:hypothetical protein